MPLEDVDRVVAALKQGLAQGGTAS
jgi:hypothetical protein